MKVNLDRNPKSLLPILSRFWQLSGKKIRSIRAEYNHISGAPVFTVAGRYSNRSWTEWTQGFEYGSSILQFDATGEEEFLKAARSDIDTHMRNYITHTGVHDHGFNVVSTYGNLHRLIREGRIGASPGERLYIETALRCSGATQAARWTEISETEGYIYSFNGPHSLFVDTIRTLRSLALAHQLGHTLLGENDAHISLFHRLVTHALTTAKYAVYYGEERDTYDVWGRTAHESVFNVNDGNYRCPATQQGYSAFSTWTRGLAWAMCGYAELLEFLDTVNDADYPARHSPVSVKNTMLKAAQATCDFFIDNTPSDGVPYWDTGAPGLSHMGDYINSVSNPYNEYEPIDSSAAAIGVQGLLRLGSYLAKRGNSEAAKRYMQAGLTSFTSLISEPYLSSDEKHQGLLLHSVYHRPNGWDHVPEGSKVPNGESCMWGDYHVREAALYVQRIAKDEPYLRFYNNQGAFQ